MVISVIVVYDDVFMSFKFPPGCSPASPPHSPGVLIDADDDDADESGVGDARRRRVATLSATAASHG